MGGPGPPAIAKIEPRRPQNAPKFGQDVLRRAKRTIRWLKMDKISGKMRQDGAKVRKMKDVPSVLDPLRACE